MCVQEEGKEEAYIFMKKEVNIKSVREMRVGEEGRGEDSRGDIEARQKRL